MKVSNKMFQNQHFNMKEMKIYIQMKLDIMNNNKSMMTLLMNYRIINLKIRMF